MNTSHMPLPADATWQKSSYSGSGNQCVEVARSGPAIAVRDSKNPSGGNLALETTRWEAFLRSIKAGAYDLQP